MSYTPPNPNGQATMANSSPVVIASDQSAVAVNDGGSSLTVDGSVSIAANSSVNVNQVGGTAIATNSGNTSAGTQRVVIATDQPQLTNALKVDGSAVTQPISASSLPLPSGAATSAKQPALGTAGTASTDVITVQGIAGGTALPVSGSMSISGSIDTELPAAAALADSTANPTVPGVGSFNEVYDDNAATWNRQRSIRHGLNNAGTGVVASGVLAEFDDSSPATVGENQFAPLRMSSRREAYTQLRDAAGNERGANVTASNALVVDGSGVTQPVSGNLGVSPQTSGGLSTFHLVSAATTNATNIKSSAGQVFGWFIYNSNASARKVAFHNTSGTPTAGASIAFAIVIPATSGANVEYTNGVAFSSGIAITTVTGLADSDATAVAVNDLVINIFYK